MNVIPSKHLIDERVLDFVDWKSALEEEDNGTIKRSHKALRELYRLYRNFQLSPSSIEARKFWFNRSA